LEFYVLCLLLGFEGRYSERERAELNSIKDKTRRRIDDIRGKPDLLSPTAVLPDAPTFVAAPLAPPVYPIRRYALIALGAVAAVVLCFILLKLDLVWEAQRASGKLL
jgi:type VI protein secretion system component VasF